MYKSSVFSSWTQSSWALACAAAQAISQYQSRPSFSCPFSWALHQDTFFRPPKNPGSAWNESLLDGCNAKLVQPCNLNPKDLNAHLKQSFELCAGLRHSRTKALFKSNIWIRIPNWKFGSAFAKGKMRIKMHCILIAANAGSRIRTYECLRTPRISELYQNAIKVRSSVALLTGLSHPGNCHCQLAPAFRTSLNLPDGNCSPSWQASTCTTCSGAVIYAG